MLGLNEAMDQLAMANSVHWHSNLLRREDRYILRKALDLEAKGHRNKGRLKTGDEKSRLRKKV